MTDKNTVYRDRFREFFRLIARVFYEEKDIVVMDAISYLFFVNQM